MRAQALAFLAEVASSEDTRAAAVALAGASLEDPGTQANLRRATDGLVRWLLADPGVRAQLQTLLWWLLLQPDTQAALVGLVVRCGGGSRGCCLVMTGLQLCSRLAWQVATGPCIARSRLGRPCTGMQTPILLFTSSISFASCSSSCFPQIATKALQDPAVRLQAQAWLVELFTDDELRRQVS